MPSEMADASRNGLRRLVDLLCVDPHQLIFLAPGKIGAVVIEDFVWDDPAAGGYEIDRSGYRIKFDRPVFSEHGVRALVTDLGLWPQLNYQNWP
jgi:hypothetical protein